MDYFTIGGLVVFCDFYGICRVFFFVAFVVKLVLMFARYVVTYLRLDCLWWFILEVHARLVRWV